MNSLISAKNIKTESKNRKKAKRKDMESKEEIEEEPEVEEEKEFNIEPEPEPIIDEEHEEEVKPKAETLGEKWIEAQQECGIDSNTKYYYTEEEDEEMKERDAEAKNKLSRDIKEIVGHFKGPKKIINVSRKPEIIKTRKQL